MDYIYDIVLNFQDNYCEFYEWKSIDKVVNFKRVAVYAVSNVDYLNLKYNDVVIDRKIIPRQNKVFLVTNKVEVMGILLDNNGRVVKRSSLLFDEADEIIDEKDTIKKLPLKYVENIRKDITLVSRLEREKFDFIEKYFNNIDVEKDKYLLKYIYYDIFDLEEDNIDKIYLKLKNLKDTDVDKIYNSIMKVNLG